MGKAKKVFLLIVEGSSDKIALATLFTDFVIDHKLNSSLEFAIYHTDISTHKYNDPDRLMSQNDDPIDNIKECIKGFISNPKENKNKFTIEDIFAVSSLSDLDCCYCSEDDLVYERFPDDALKKTKVDFTNKKFVCNDITFIKNRNVLKTDSLAILSSETRFSIDKHIILYKAFYNSVNLEHAFYGDTGNYTEDEKCDLANKFVDNNIEEMKALEDILSSTPRLADNYKDSWDEKILFKNAFERCSNLIFILDWLIHLFSEDSKDDL